jgi:hypothetical protein
MVEFRDVPEGPSRLQVSAEGFCPLEHRIERLVTHEESVVVRLQRSSGRLAGFLVSTGGAPLAGALLCLDTRTRLSPSPGPPATQQSRRTRSDEAWAMPHAVSDERGTFALELVPGAATLLVCPGRDGLPLLLRRELEPEELAGLLPLVVEVPPAEVVSIRFLQENGAPAAGSLELSDGLVLHDLAADPVLRRIPAIGRWNGSARVPGGVRVHLVPGGYEAVQRTGRGQEARFVRVRGGPAEELELEVPAPAGS